MDKGAEGSREARLEYRLLSSGELDGREVSLVEIHLLTGRHHQIRVQFASRGLPLLGDEKYGDGNLANRRPGRFRREPLALYAWRLEFDHPGGPGSG